MMWKKMLEPWRDYLLYAVAVTRAFPALPPLCCCCCSLWNKLGATLANHSHSSQAVAAYRKALELKPNYMRAWTNMGISYANLGDYKASAAYYVRALSMNPQAEHVWGYLRTSLACGGEVELLNVVEAKDLQALQAALPIMK
jgi:peroxin-5